MVQHGTIRCKAICKNTFALISVCARPWLSWYRVKTLVMLLAYRVWNYIVAGFVVFEICSGAACVLTECLRPVMLKIDGCCTANTMRRSYRLLEMMGPSIASSAVRVQPPCDIL